ncbi:MAG TPA: ergothioneine biosynthesis protein EgtC [Kineosporiaceae bacterium]
MCRHLAYVGRPVRLGEFLTDPPHSLVVQSYRPRRQDHGLFNADGFGVGWYVADEPGPARHRGGGPAWSDETLAELARVISAPALLAAVRSATPGTAPGTTAAAPFRAGRWLFSHNGALDGWPGTAAGLAAGLPPERLLALEARTDAALLWAATLDRLEAGATPGQALTDVVGAALAGGGGGRLNLLLTDGCTIAATRHGASLSWRRLAGGVVVASEPYDDGPDWSDVPDHHLLVADPDGVRVTPF